MAANLFFGHGDRSVDRKYARSVCSIMSRYKVGERILQERGTGFLVRCLGELCILTNSHVIPDRTVAKGCKLTFVDTIPAASCDKEVALDVFLCPSVFFLTSGKPRPANCPCFVHRPCVCRISGKCDLNHLDYTICAVSGPGIQDRMPMAIPRSSPHPVKGSSVYILHTTKTAGVLRCTMEKVTRSDQFNIVYFTNTPAGSSGSPIFNSIHELVAIHRAGGREVLNGDIFTSVGGTWTKPPSDEKYKSLSDIFSTPYTHIHTCHAVPMSTIAKNIEAQLFCAKVLDELVEQTLDTVKRLGTTADAASDHTKNNFEDSLWTLGKTVSETILVTLQELGRRHSISRTRLCVALLSCLSYPGSCLIH